ncbi:MAG: 16S rRNA (adenine(1518)-N(6)/adenine(1519)-N(6))-dimethyltransferase RsmA, partial [Roseimicrobium sp.]
MSFVPKKSLGQNFLHDAQLARWIADQITPDGAPLVVEVGPGQGALTEHLMGRPQRLLLIEKDNALAADLSAELADSDTVELWHGDAARSDLRPLFKHGRVKLVGNLPYSAGGVILRHFLTPPTPIAEAVFMLQKEVCERIAAHQEDDAYGALSLHIQHDWDAQILRIVPPEAFKPRPRVHSAIVRLTRKAPGALPVHDARLFDRLVRMGFAQRRKQLKNLLPDAPEGWEALVNALGAPVTV